MQESQLGVYFVVCQKCNYSYTSKKNLSQCGKCGNRSNEGFDLPKWIKWDKRKGKYILIRSDSD